MDEDQRHRYSGNVHALVTPWKETCLNWSTGSQHCKSGGGRPASNGIPRVSQAKGFGRELSWRHQKNDFKEKGGHFKELKEKDCLTVCRSSYLVALYTLQLYCCTYIIVWQGQT